MGKQSIKERLKKESVEYFSISSIHGTGYFFTDLNLFEKLFWVVIVIIMTIFSCILINSALVSWKQNPTITNTASIDSPISNIQFPTITLCTDFTPDRYGHVRNLLNVYKFQCNSDEECEINQPARSADNLDHDLMYQLLPDYGSDRNVIGINAEKLVEKLMQPNIIPFEDTLSQGFTWDMLTSRIVETCISYKNGMQAFSDHLKGLLVKKLRAQRNNYAIYSFLNVDMTAIMPTCEYESPYTSTYAECTIRYNFPSNSSCTGDEMRRLVIATYLVLTMPLPGSAGTYALNFFFDPSLSIPGTWMVMPSSRTYNTESLLFQYITAGMFNSSELGLSLTEVAAILYPVPTYLASQKFPRQFPWSLFNQKLKIMADPINTVRKYDIPLILTIPNCFGQLIGPYWQQAMEIMFHCQLRVRPIYRDRFLRVMDIYQGFDYFQEYMQYLVDLTDEPFIPKWTDYTSFNKTPYLWLRTARTNNFTMSERIWFIDFLQFQNDPDEEYKAWYNSSRQLEFNKILDDLRGTYQYQNILTRCKGPGANRTCVNKFQPTLTDNGICYTFNALNFSSTYINNTYIDTFKHIYEPDDNSDEILLNENSGKSFQMYILLDSHQSKIMDNIAGTFKVAINQMLGFMNVRDNAIDVELGYTTKLTISVTQYTTSDNFRNLDLKERNCRYMEENPDANSLFQFYSLEACTFECKVKYSAAKCGCTPINYPQYISDITEICDGVQSYCFDTKMNDKVNVSTCNCLPNCEDIIFTVKSDKYDMNYAKECDIPSDLSWGMSLNENDLRLVVAEKIRHMEGEEFMFWYNMLSNDSNSGADLLNKSNFARYVDPRLTQKECRALLEKDFALLIIDLSSATMKTLERDIAIDFVTKIGNIGGTLGLFTGMSILSFFEIAFFLYKLGTIPFKPVKKEKKKK